LTSSSSIGLPPGAARDLVDLLRELASAGDSTNASIARKAGVSASYVSQILNGRKFPSPDVAARIANAIEGADRHELAVRGLAEKAAEARRYDRAHRAVEAAARTGADIEATSVAFLLALDTAHLALRQVAAAPAGPGRVEAAVQAVASTSLYTDRERLLVSAEPRLAAAGEAVFLALVDIRTAVKHGAGLDSEAYHRAYHPFAAAVWSLRQAIRAAAGREPLTPAEMRRDEWSDLDRCPTCTEGGFTTIHR
jgi:transcriptional regulator with XRE-family HTH domain